MSDVKANYGSAEKKSPPEALSAPPTPQDPESSPPETSAPAPTKPAIVELIELRNAEPSDEDIKKLIHRHLAEELASEALGGDYKVLVLYDSLQLDRSDTDKIYAALSDRPVTDPILLIIDSGGGSISPAYFIAKLCREYSRDRFEVAVPRRAKSAATLICCGADVIHMGSLSELGPIDPQLDGVPALALKHSIENLAELCKMYPDAAEMFAKYMSQSLRIESLGYYERVAASATHYAARLLRSRRMIVQDETAIEGIAARLVYAYKDHSFAIDADEAEAIFGGEVVVRNTKQYRYANKLYGAIDLVEWAVGRFFDRHLAFTGSLDSGAVLTKRTKK